MNLGNPLSTGEKARKKGIHLGFKTHATQMAPQKGHVSSQKLKKETIYNYVGLFLEPLPLPFEITAVIFFFVDCAKTICFVQMITKLISIQRTYVSML